MMSSLQFVILVDPNLKNIKNSNPIGFENCGRVIGNFLLFTRFSFQLWGHDPSVDGLGVSTTFVKYEVATPHLDRAGDFAVHGNRGCGRAI